MDSSRSCNRNVQNRCYYNQGSSVKYVPHPRTPQQSDAGEKSCSKPVDSQPIGMAYIPEQPFDNLYDAKCGLREGTMFKNLNLIFCGARGK
jgi:hypothetical protein